jgi:hypothetical protein
MDPRVRYVLCKHKIALEFEKLSWQLNRHGSFTKRSILFCLVYGVSL